MERFRDPDRGRARFQQDGARAALNGTAERPAAAGTGRRVALCSVVAGGEASAGDMDAAVRAPACETAVSLCRRGWGLAGAAHRAAATGARRTATLGGGSRDGVFRGVR